ncbi:gpalpp motif-containing protein 1 [Lasius niger]|uniref:Gpalpp motif-containing protein 1 n=1 Tax=Lasius niger TaxID=67767 RepID=A0A0J7K780_LASNI|nr:gpalpp motif-containing protein 1 [Lasius niger]
MDSDSESQDSDDGRRFRFEATRKDSVAPIDTADRTKTPKKKSKHKSSHCESSRHYRTDRKERSKHESGRNTDDKDLRYSVKYSKHESRSSRQEDGRNSYKDYRTESGDISAGSAANDKGYKNSNESDMREKVSRDSKRQSDRDRSAHQMQRSREHSYERNHHNERASSDKHRSRHHERHKHHSRDRSRDRSHQSSRLIKSSNGDYRSREDQGRHDASKKTLVKENKSQNSRDYPKNVERHRSYSEARLNENIKKDTSIEIQDCKDLDLSQFDVLSETGENVSDCRDSGSRTSSPCPRKTKLKRHDSEDRSENHARTKRENDGDEASGGKRREQLKVKRRNYDPASGSINNNPSAVSDSLFSSASSATFLVTRETRMDSARKKASEHYEEERMMINPDSGECSNLEEKYSQCLDSLDEPRLLEKDTKETESVYGPFLPPKFTSNTDIADGDKPEKSSSSNLDENKIDDDGKSASFIGPCLLPQLNDDHQNGKREDAEDAVTLAMETDNVFGPALPPHLLQRQQNENDSRDKIIGPVLPDTMKSHKEASTESSDDDCAIGPLPVDHPALKNNRVHEQLDLRAQRIRHEGLEETDLGNKREEWMTELPPAQAATLGLGPRKFRLRDGPDMSDRSCWTDTPAQKAQKQKDSEAKRLRESDTEHVKEFHKKEANEKRKSEKSLLEMHQSKIAKKKKKEEKEAKRIGISMRRPFDRDIDLQVNKFDQAQKKTILRKAQLLDDRFSRGQI